VDVRRTGNATRQVSSAVISGDNTSRDVVIETVHARHADTLPNVTNKSAAQGMSSFCLLSHHDGWRFSL